MSRRNYPLTALRAFEAAARHASNAEAAKELHVTPAAVSQQVKTLEGYFDKELFIRQPNDLQLTDIAKQLLPTISEGFIYLDQAVEDIIGEPSSDELTISAAPMFTAKWLSPRLEQFNERYPSINLHMSSSLSLIDFNRNAADAAIRLGAHAETGLDMIDLFEEQLVPICSPNLLKNNQHRLTPEDISSFTLIHDDSLDSILGEPGWKIWFEKFAKEDVNWSSGPHFSQPDHAAQSAIDGAGFILGWKSLSSYDIANNRLVVPLDYTIPLGSYFSLVYPKAYAHREKIIAFKEWLLSEVEAAVRSL